jgi:hypothetical protein
MTCDAFRSALRDGAGESDEMRGHAASCPRCAADLRSHRLLLLGSGDGAPAPRPGFEARLRARIAAAPDRRGWTDALAPIARPALVAAALVAFAMIAIHGWVGSRQASDLALLAEEDPSLFALLEGDLGSLVGDGEDVP